MNAIDYEAKNRNKAFDELLESLPHRIRNELLTIIYENLIQDNVFFQDKSVEFIGCIVPKLKFYRFDENDYIYKVAEAASEMYFLIKGEVSLLFNGNLGQMIQYLIVQSGYHFGEIDMLLNPQ